MLLHIVAYLYVWLHHVPYHFVSKILNYISDSDVRNILSQILVIERASEVRLMLCTHALTYECVCNHSIPKANTK